MYQVLIVDDEKIEREGISALIDWEHYGFQLLGAAKNGVEALEMISRQAPDIVITDIKMPVISGIDLIRQVAAGHPKIVFAVLSGYGDYEFTSKAMLLGVRHYLLKPLGRETLLETLKNISEEIEKRDQNKEMVDQLKENFTKVLPHVKEQFLRRSIQSNIYEKKDYAYFKSLFRIEAENFRLVVIRFLDRCDFLDRYAMKNMAEEMIGSEAVCLDSILEQDVILLTVLTDDLTAMKKTMSNVGKEYARYFHPIFSMAISDPGGFTDINAMFQQTSAFFRYRFSLPENAVLNSGDLRQASSSDACSLSQEIDGICELVRSGGSDELDAQIECFFSRMEKAGSSLFEIKNYCRKLCREAFDGTMPQTVIQAFSADTSFELREEIKSTLNRVCMTNNDGKNLKEQNPIVKSIIQCVYENISNPELNLHWIAKSVLFMNEDYLGRVFFKEKGEKFTKYVLHIRMGIAQKLLENPGKLRVREIAEMTGFSDDVQYFSRVFKNFVGCTPVEYQRSCRRA